MKSDELFDAGFRQHQAGNLHEAQALYQQVLSAEPRHADAMHLLGVLMFQLGRLDTAGQLIAGAIAIKPSAEYLGNLGLVLDGQGKDHAAVDAYQQAISLRGDFAEAHNNLANTLRKTGDLHGAILAYRRAIECRPEFFDAHNNLALSLAIDGQFEQAVASFDNAIALRPGAADVQVNRGNALQQLGRGEQAIAAFALALLAQPDLPEAHNNIGVIHFDRRNVNEAIAAYRRALAARPDFPDAHYNLAIALHADGEVSEAIIACRRAIALRPRWAEAYNNLGIWLGQTARAADAIAAFDAAVDARPGYVEAHCNRGNVLRETGKPLDALESYRRALALRPDDARVRNNLGACLNQLGRSEEASSAFREALTLLPDLAEAHNNLGNLLKDQGELDKALACYDRAAVIQPGDAATASNRVYTLHFHPSYSAAMILAEHENWNRRHAGPVDSSNGIHANELTTNRRLRIGYVAPDFRDHCQSLFTVPLLSHHDRSQVDVYCYSDVAVPDATTARLRGYAHAWREIAGLSDASAASIIRADKIDILVDLTVHMSHNRLAMFAKKPAPVQVTWLGYPGTTGLAAMDYRLSDPHLDPPGNESFYAEQTIRLPETFWCYDPLTRDPKVNALSALANGYVTFGCLNNFCKVTSDTLRLWAKILRATPDSRLLLLAPEGNARQRVSSIFSRNGIDPQRVTFSGRLSRRRYLELYHRIDIGLDTFPYNGHTTSLDAAWMGVPVVTRMGQTAVSRGGFSQLCNLGLHDLASKSDAGFIEIAVKVASDPHRLADLRSTLRTRLENSPLMNAGRFAAHMELAYRRMWQAYVLGKTSKARPGRKRLKLYLTDAARRPKRHLRHAS